jgi:integrase
MHVHLAFATGSRQIRVLKWANIGKHMQAKITVQKWQVRGQIQWAVHRVEAGKRKRAFFHSKRAAEAEAARLRAQQAAVGDVGLSLPAPDRQRLIQVHYEAKQLGVDLADLLADWKRRPRFTGSSPALGHVIAELLEAKTSSGRSARYVKALAYALNPFARGRERVPFARLGLRDIEGFLNSKGVPSRPTLRARLATLFRFAVRRGYRADNPCDRLESIKVLQRPPSILTVGQTKKALVWLDAKQSRAFGWFVLTTFAGLRPEEAEKTGWQAINFAEGWIRVEAQTTQVRQRRVVHPPATAMAWLRRAKQRGAELPVARQPRRRAIRQLRTLLGLGHWPKDVTRHSAAAYWLADTGSAAQVAAALGHSENVLRKNYLALVTKAQAREFWQLLPQGNE